MKENNWKERLYDQTDGQNVKNNTVNWQSNVFTLKVIRKERIKNKLKVK